MKFINCLNFSSVVLAASEGLSCSIILLLMERRSVDDSLFLIRVACVAGWMTSSCGMERVNSLLGI